MHMPMYRYAFNLEQMVTVLGEELEQSWTYKYLLGTCACDVAFSDSESDSESESSETSDHSDDDLLVR